jgi:hypothetical protein
VNEKYDQFFELYGTKPRMRVIRCTGDHNDQVSAFLRGKYDLALLTYEMFLQLVVGSPFTLGQLGLIVVDRARRDLRLEIKGRKLSALCRFRWWGWTQIPLLFRERIHKMLQRGRDDEAR